MTPTMTSYPLSFYIEKLERGEPFASVLYGDGEFQVAAGLVTGARFTSAGEHVTQALADEMRAGLMAGDEPGLLRGTDFNLIDWRRYDGGDAFDFRAAGSRVEEALFRFLPPNLEFVDGTVWDDACRDEGLAPLLRALHGRRVVLVGNRRLRQLRFLHPWHTSVIAEEDAANMMDHVEKGLTAVVNPTPDAVFVFCAGLMSVPLILRLRQRWPWATFLDLGSTFDVFVGGGADRGWRKEAYSNPAKLRNLVERHLEGVCGPDCGKYRVGSSAPGGTFRIERGKVVWE